MEQIAARVLALILRHGNVLESGMPELKMYETHLKKICRAVERGDTLELALPAFPAKSPNREKTIGNLPDFAELLGLQRLQEVCREIAAIYAPGATVTICSDGHVFADLVLVSDEKASAYRANIRAMIEERGLTNLRTFSMEDVFAGENFSAMRQRLVDKHGRRVEEIHEKTRHCPATQALFNGIHRFIFEDRLALEKNKTRNRVREESKQVAYQVIQRSNSWSNLVEKTFPDAVRLSIHPQCATSAKIGFQLVDCHDRWSTPWHGVAYHDHTGFRLMKRKEAEALDAVVIYAYDKYPYFQQPRPAAFK